MARRTQTTHTFSSNTTAATFVRWLIQHQWDRDCGYPRYIDLRPAGGPEEWCVEYTYEKDFARGVATGMEYTYEKDFARGVATGMEYAATHPNATLPKRVEEYVAYRTQLATQHPAVMPADFATWCAANTEI